MSITTILSTSTLEILSFLGIGTLCSLIVTTLFTCIKNFIESRSKKVREAKERPFKELSEKVDNLSSGVEQLDTKIDSMKNHIVEVSDRSVQALLRNKLYELYDLWIPRKYAPDDVKENFENLYSRYHDLGKNGVMDKKREEFMELPNHKPSHKKENEEN